MSGKVKMRCARCGKPFKSAGAKHTLCPECESKERVARAAGTIKVQRPVVTPPRTQHPTIVGPGAGILVPDLAPKGPLTKTEPSATHAPPERRNPLDARDMPQGQHSQHSVSERIEHSQAHRSTPKPAKPERSPKAATLVRAPAPAYVLTDEVRARIEARYQELAAPVEFDGIRTQIASELSIPKPMVKRTVAELRKRLQLPSWWELQSYSGSADDLERIRAAYLPSLPIPEVGVHKHLAEQLGLDSGVVYQGIRRIRAEMHLPQYNPPETHETLPPVSTALASGNDAE
ncbi:MAG: hypothetical protein ACLQUY_13945 [Ktedonobacterales bacterium]